MTDHKNEVMDFQDPLLDDNLVDMEKVGEEQSVSTEESSLDDPDVVKYEYDEAVIKFGDGRHQVFLYLMLGLVTFSTVFCNNGYIFIGAEQDHVCSKPDNYNVTNSTMEVNYIADQCTLSKVTRYENGTNSTSTEKCSKWDYDQTFFTNTMMSEWNFNNCDGKWKISLASSIYMLGFFTGCILLGALSDKYGRMKMISICGFGMAVAGVGASFSVNYPMLVIMRYILGIFAAGARNSSFVYVCEVVAPRWRAGAGMGCGTIYSIGGVIVTFISYSLPNWRDFQLCCALCMAIYIPFYWILPESPRWLLSQRRHEEAHKYFKLTAQVNRVTLPEKFKVYLLSEAGSEGSIFTLVRTPNLRKITAIVCVLWFSVSAMFFGMSYNVGNLTGDIFVNNYLLQVGGTLEFIGMWYLLLGRRTAISSAFIFASIISALIPAIQGLGRYGTIVLAMLGKLLVETNFEMVYVATSEIYPTTARVTALGLGSCFARLGGAASPYIVLTNDLWSGLPYVIFSAIAGIAGITGFLLPETLNKMLPDSVKEAEDNMLINTRCEIVCYSKVIRCCKNSSPHEAPPLDLKDMDTENAA